jgi:GTPase
MFIDELEITLKAGHGGAGKVSFYRPPMRGPDGGNGGKGGDLYIKVVDDPGILARLSGKKLVEAQNGVMGQGNRKFGLDGQDKDILLPVGALIKDLNTGEELELKKGDDRILFCKGGLGGRGNYEFKSSRNTTPEYAQSGLPGEEKAVSITLRLIADYGLVGLPNSGKSSLLNELTSAQAKIGDYPFTTLEPNLGACGKKIIADIPGLIEGASSGKGLGVNFLKHIEKVQSLLHTVAADSQDPLQDYETVRNELKSYNPELIKKSELILITKTDLGDKNRLKEIKKLFKKKKVVEVSIYDYDSIEKLKDLLRS